MDTLELCDDLLLPGGQLETPGLVHIDLIYEVPSLVSRIRCQGHLYPLSPDFILIMPFYGS